MVECWQASMNSKGQIKIKTVFSEQKCIEYNFDSRYCVVYVEGNMIRVG